MKIKTTVAALSVLSVLSFGAFAADSIDAAQAQNREAIGTVSVSGVASSPMDMREMLNKKAEEKGATAYQITEARSGDTWHALPALPLPHQTAILTRQNGDAFSLPDEQIQSQVVAAGHRSLTHPIVSRDRVPYLSPDQRLG